MGKRGNYAPLNEATQISSNASYKNTTPFSFKERSAYLPSANTKNASMKYFKFFCRYDKSSSQTETERDTLAKDNAYQLSSTIST